MVSRRLSAVGRRLLIITLLPASAAVGQQQGASHASHGAAAPKLSHDEITALARAQVAITMARDSSNVQRAKQGNKTKQAQEQLQEKLRLEVAEILLKTGLTEPEYQRRQFVVSTDTAIRRVFDSVVVAVTGAPLPGYAARAAIFPVPAGPSGVHIGHVVNGSSETPSLQGFLPAAVAEARIAIQHATLSGRQPTNLEYMKTHAGHVIHALDPTVITMGPGLGYGLKKAANNVVTHLELAVAAEGAPPNVATHSKHIIVAARNTVTRVDQVLELAKKVQAAKTAEEAAALVSQMTSAAEQLIAGVDANGDGRITWDVGEGGLQHAEEHVRLMLRP